MLEHVEVMFDGMSDMMKKLKKASYEKNMKEFREKNDHFLIEMVSYVEHDGNHEKAADDIAESFVQQVKNAFSVGGRMKSRMQADLNFFMIYYVFPALLLTDHEYADLVAKKICALWGSTFRDSKIGYADYNRIYSGFREKIFGIF
jgi:hypothetical protein